MFHLSYFTWFGQMLGILQAMNNRMPMNFSLQHWMCFINTVKVNITVPETHVVQ